MNVCQDCGLNVSIFANHAPGCKYRTSDKPNFEDEPGGASPGWEALMEVSTERGRNLSKTLLRDAMRETLDVEEGVSIEHLDDVLFDDATMKILSMCSWAGVISTIQILMEQGLIDQEAMIMYLSGDSDGTI